MPSAVYPGFDMVKFQGVAMEPVKAEFLTNTLSATVGLPSTSHVPPEVSNRASQVSVVEPTGGDGEEGIGEGVEGDGSCWAGGVGDRKGEEGGGCCGNGDGPACGCLYQGVSPSAFSHSIFVHSSWNLVGVTTEVTASLGIQETRDSPRGVHKPSRVSAVRVPGPPNDIQNGDVASIRGRAEVQQVRLKISKKLQGRETTVSTL